MDDSFVLYPAYLRDNNLASHTYGTLSYNKKSKCWTIKGDPCVTELAKRLFPGCDGRGRGVARFTAHRRIIGELNWLMLRYPLTIKPQDVLRWEAALLEAREYAIKKERLHEQPSIVNPPKDVFKCDLMGFQQEGVGYLLSNTRCLLADEMGLGKTVQALGYLAASGALPAIIIVPPHLIRNWQREIDRFLHLPTGTKVHVIKGLKPYELPKADIYIIHYLLLRGWKKELPKLNVKTVIFDEIQELRHAGTEKYSAASLLSTEPENVIGLSGTPIYNKGGEIWNVINILDFHFLGDWESFTREWCYGYGNGIVVKPDVLGDHLRHEGLMLRRTKGDVLTQLPPKRRLVQEIDWDDSLYRELMLPVIEKLKDLKSVDDASRRAILEDQISQGERQATGMAKAPYVAAFIKALVDAGEKVLVFAHHHAVMDTYKRELKAHKPVFVTGRETTTQKEQAVDAFMGGKTDICIISLRAASGLNLQRATCVVFGELDWSPAVHSQAEDRAHRIGQYDSLLCYYLVSPKGSDQDMQEALGLKVSQFLGLMGDKVPSALDVFMQESQARERIRQVVDRLTAIMEG